MLARGWMAYQLDGHEFEQALEAWLAATHRITKS